MKLLVYLVVFGIASWGSRFIMRKRGYPMPQSFSTKVDRILTVMHLLWFAATSPILHYVHDLRLGVSAQDDSSAILLGGREQGTGGAAARALLYSSQNVQLSS